MKKELKRLMSKDVLISPVNATEVFETDSIYNICNRLIPELLPVDTAMEVYTRRNSLRNIFNNRVEFLLNNITFGMNEAFNSILNIKHSNIEFSIMCKLKQSKYNFIFEVINYGMLITPNTILDIATSISTEAFNIMCDRLNEIVTGNDYRSGDQFKSVTTEQYAAYLDDITALSVAFAKDMINMLTALLVESSNVYCVAGAHTAENDEICSGDVMDLRYPMDKQPINIPGKEHSNAVPCNQGRY